jgi:hypothetical protein
MDTNIIGSSSGTLTVATDKFNGIYMASSAWGTAITTQNVMPVAGTLKNFYINCDAGPGAGISRTFAIYKNGVDTALTITVSGSGTGAGVSTGNDTTHNVAFVAGDTISIHSTATATTTTAGVVRWTLAATCLANTSMILGSSGGNMGTTFPVYVAFQGIENETTGSFLEEVLPTVGTIKNAYVQLNNTATAIMTFTLVQNGVDTSLVVTVGTGSATGNDLNAGHAVTAAAGDRFYWRLNAAAAASRTAFISVQFSPSVNGESVHLYSGNRAQTTTATRFQTLTNNGGGGFTATEAPNQQLSQAAIWQKLYVYEQPAITTGNYLYQLAVNGVQGSPTVTVSAGQQTGSDTSNTRTISVGGTVSMGVAPISSPNSASVEWGIVSYIPPPQTKLLSLGLLGVG